MASLLEQLGVEVVRIVDAGSGLQGELHQVAGEIAELEREIQRLVPRSNNKASKALAQLAEAKRRLKFSDDRLEALGSVGVQWLTANGLVGATNSTVSGFVSAPEARPTRGEPVTLDEAPELSWEAAGLTELGLEPGNYVLGNVNTEISPDGFESGSGGKHGPRVDLKSDNLWVTPTAAHGVSFDTDARVENPDELFRFKESVHDYRDGLHLGMPRVDKGFSWVSVEGVLSEYARQREETVWLSDAPELSDLAERVRDLGLDPGQYQLGKGTHVDLTDRFAGQGRFGSCVVIATARAYVDKRGGIDAFYDRFFEMKDDGTVDVLVGDSVVNVQPTLPQWNTGRPHDAGASDWANPVASSLFGLWEKAHAIRMGGYDRLDRGMYLQEGLSSLNPQANWNEADVSAASVESLRSWFHSNDVANNAVLMNFSKNVEIPESDDYLLNHHAYVVSDIDFEKGKVRLRNPWQNIGPLVDSRVMPTTLKVNLLDILPFIAQIVGIPFP